MTKITVTVVEKCIFYTSRVTKIGVLYALKIMPF